MEDHYLSSDSSISCWMYLIFSIKRVFSFSDFLVRFFFLGTRKKHGLESSRHPRPGPVPPRGQGCLGAGFVFTWGVPGCPSTDFPIFGPRYQPLVRNLKITRNFFLMWIGFWWAIIWVWAGRMTIRGVGGLWVANGQTTSN